MDANRYVIQVIAGAEIKKGDFLVLDEERHVIPMPDDFHPRNGEFGVALESAPEMTPLKVAMKALSGLAR